MKVFDTISSVRALGTKGETKGDLAKRVIKHVKFRQHVSPGYVVLSAKCSGAVPQPHWCLVQTFQARARALVSSPEICSKIFARLCGAVSHPCGRLLAQAAAIALLAMRLF